MERAEAVLPEGRGTASPANARRMVLSSGIPNANCIYRRVRVHPMSTLPTTQTLQTERKRHYIEEEEDLMRAPVNPRPPTAPRGGAGGAIIHGRALAGRKLDREETKKKKKKEAKPQSERYYRKLIKKEKQFKPSDPKLQALLSRIKEKEAAKDPRNNPAIIERVHDEMENLPGVADLEKDDEDIECLVKRIKESDDRVACCRVGRTTMTMLADYVPMPHLDAREAEFDPLHLRRRLAHYRLLKTPPAEKKSMMRKMSQMSIVSQLGRLGKAMMSSEEMGGTGQGGDTPAAPRGNALVAGMFKKIPLFSPGREQALKHEESMGMSEKPMTPDANKSLFSLISDMNNSKGGKTFGATARNRAIQDLLKSRKAAPPFDRKPVRESKEVKRPMSRRTRMRLQREREKKDEEDKNTLERLCNEFARNPTKQNLTLWLDQTVLLQPRGKDAANDVTTPDLELPETPDPDKDLSVWEKRHQKIVTEAMKIDERQEKRHRRLTTELQRRDFERRLTLEAKYRAMKMEHLAEAPPIGMRAVRTIADELKMQRLRQWHDRHMWFFEILASLKHYAYEELGQREKGAKFVLLRNTERWMLHVFKEIVEQDRELTRNDLLDILSIVVHPNKKPTWIMKHIIEMLCEKVDIDPDEYAEWERQHEKKTLLAQADVIDDRIKEEEQYEQGGSSDEETDMEFELEVMEKEVEESGLERVSRMELDGDGYPGDGDDDDDGDDDAEAALRKSVAKRGRLESQVETKARIEKKWNLKRRARVRSVIRFTMSHQDDDEETPRKHKKKEKKTERSLERLPSLQDRIRSVSMPRRDNINFDEELEKRMQKRMLEKRRASILDVLDHAQETGTLPHLTPRDVDALNETSRLSVGQDLFTSTPASHLFVNPTADDDGDTLPPLRRHVGTPRRVSVGSTIDPKAAQVPAPPVNDLGTLRKQLGGDMRSPRASRLSPLLTSRTQGAVDSFEEETGQITSRSVPEPPTTSKPKRKGKGRRAPVRSQPRTEAMRGFHKQMDQAEKKKVEAEMAARGLEYDEYDEAWVPRKEAEEEPLPVTGLDQGSNPSQGAASLASASQGAATARF